MPGAPAAARAKTGKKPIGLIIGVIGVVVIAAVLFLVLGKKNPAPGPVVTDGETQAAVEAEPPALGDSPEARAADQARGRMMAVKNSASQAGLDSGLPVIRAAITLEKEADKRAGDKEFTEAALAFAVAERIYRVSVELSSDDLRLEGLKAFVAEARAAADQAISANPENKLLLQALAFEREGEVATIKKNTEDAALAHGRAALAYRRIESSFRTARK